MKEKREIVKMKEEVKIIKNLIEACSTLMDEICKQKATNWGIVNNALVEGERYVSINKENKK